MMTGHLATVAVLTVSGLLIPRIMGVEAFGRYAAVLAVVGILQAVSRLGVQKVAVRFLPPLWQAQDRSQALALGSTIWTVRMTATPLAAVAGCLWLGATVAADQHLAVLLALGLLCALRPAQEATLNLFLATGHVGKLTGFELLRAALRLPAVVATFLVFGLPGVFLVLPLLQAGVWVWALAVLRRIFPLRPALSRWSVLRPYLSFGLSSFVNEILVVLQSELSIFAVAAWVTAREAGTLALAMHLYLLVRGLYMAAHRSLKPLLAEIEAEGRDARLLSWSELMMAFGVAGFCLVAVLWALLGRSALHLVFGEDFALVYLPATILLASLILLSAAMTCNELLYIRNRPWTGTANTAVHTAAILGGLVLVLGSGSPSAALGIAWVYLAASALFFAGSYVSLARRGRLRLPLGRSLLLALPVALVVPAAGWEANLVPRLLAAAAFVGLYSLVVVRLGLLDPGRELIASLRHRRQGSEAPKDDRPRL